MKPVDIKKSEAKRAAIGSAYAMAQVILCLIGAYLIASGFSLFGGEDAMVNSLMSKGPQRLTGMIAFSVGTFLWWFEDYIL